MASLFDAFRIDNCHSTPLHVAKYLLDVARTARPNLYVFAELFTGNEERDVVFVKELGIHSLVREAMNAWDVGEIGRCVWKYSHGVSTPTTLPSTVSSTTATKTTFTTGQTVHLRGSTPHVLFMDCTHDNETPHQKRTAEDTLPNSAIVCFSRCASGSVLGYDTLTPTLLNVVTSTLKYPLSLPTGMHINTHTNTKVHLYKHTDCKMAYFNQRSSYKNFT